MSELNPKQLNRIARLKQVADQGNLAVAKYIFDIEDMIDESMQVVDEKIKNIESTVSPNLNNILEQVRGKDGKDGQSIVGDKGDKGDKGDRGEQGVRGNDGKNGRDGRDGRDGIDGLNGQDGRDGIDGHDGSPDNPQQIADKLNTLHEKVNPEVIIGWNDLQNKIRNNVPRDFDVRIGVSQTDLQRLASRVSTLESNPSSGGGVSNITITGTINDSNVTFTSASQPTYLVINGATYSSTGGAITWTYVAGTITLSSPVGIGGSIFGLGAGGSSGTGGHTIEDEGTPLTARTNLNFVGAGVAVTDDSGNDATVVTINGGGAMDIIQLQVFS